MRGEMKFDVGDVVVTPTGRRAVVHGFIGDRVDLLYEGAEEKVLLRPEWLRLP